jgi:short-subunit dehydrogenase
MNPRKSILITGGSKGFGRSIAEAFAGEGYDIWLCARTKSDLENTTNGIRDLFPGVRASFLDADLSHMDGIMRLVSWVRSQGSTMDVLVNNAGIFFPGSVVDEEDGVLEKIMDTNLYSAYHLTRKLLPDMIRRKSGHIFNMCSIAALKAYPNGGAYSISKFALHGFSANLREEMKPHGIKVTSVFPGAAYTDSWAGSGIDPGRIMEAEDIATMILAASKLSPQACVEDIVMRPQLGDL